MARNPIEIEMRGLQTPRERVWASILALRAGFSIGTVQDACSPMVPYKCVGDYFSDLLAAGYIKRVRKGSHIPGRTGVVKTQDQYDLVKEQFEAPRLKDGRPVTKGEGVLAMWRVMKVLQKNFSAKEVQQNASQNGVVVELKSAQMYIGALAQAGYLKQLPSARYEARYTLVRNTGPKPPAITRHKCVFDRNTGEFAYLETAQEVCDAAAD